jgi:hypothetical protein
MHDHFIAPVQAFNVDLCLGAIGEPRPGAGLGAGQQSGDCAPAAPQRQVSEVLADVEQPQHFPGCNDR